MKKYIFLGALLCLSCSISAWTQNKALIKNVGQVTDQNLQTRSDIDFKVSEQKGLQVFIGAGQLHYQWLTGSMQEDSSMLYNSYRLDVNLLGSNANARIVYGQQQAAYERYFLSWVNTDNSDAGKVAHRYESVTYQDIYPSIDWKLYFTSEGHLEYDFIVHPGGSVADIQLQHLGADSVRIQEDGAMMVFTPKGIIKEQAPYSYDYKTKQTVSSSFVQNKDIITFATAPHQGTLVIDPVIEWGTYFGDVAADAANDIAVDSIGNIYMVGTTSSLNNIATIGAYQQTFGGSTSDGFISKWTDGGQLVWATYFGGAKVDIIKRVYIGTDGLLYLGGYTNSIAGIATVGAYQDTLHGNQYDIFWAKYDTSGQRMYATYFGGSSNEGNTAMDMNLDMDHNIYLVGTTNSLNYPITPNAYRSVGQSGESFIAKFSAQGQLLYSSYLGGELADVATGIAIDTAKNMYVTGYTKSTTGIATAGAFQTVHQGDDDVFFMKLDSLGILIWGTYFGGNNLDKSTSIVISDSIVVIAGNTRSSNQIATINSFQINYRGGANNLNDDGFLAVFNKSGALLWSSYLGGNRVDIIKGMTFSSTHILVAFETTSEDSVAFGNSLFDIHNGSRDGGIAKFDFIGNCSWVSYLGGAGIDRLNSIKLFNNNQLYIVGETQSANNIAFGSSYLANIVGNYDAFMLKIDLCEAPQLNSSILGFDTVCSNVPQHYVITHLPDAVLYNWLLPTGWQGQSDSNSISVITGAQGGLVQVWAESSCGGISDTVSLEVYVHPTVNVSIQLQNGILRSNNAYPSYQWLKDGIVIPNAINSTFIPTENGVYALQIIDENGCVFVSNDIHMEGLSLLNVSNNIMKIYPNPSTKEITLELHQAAQIEVYNSLGQSIIRRSLDSGTHVQDISHWTNGVYLILIQTQEGLFYQQIIKQ